MHFVWRLAPTITIMQTRIFTRRLIPPGPAPRSAHRLLTRNYIRFLVQAINFAWQSAEVVSTTTAETRPHGIPETISHILHIWLPYLVPVLNFVWRQIYMAMLMYMGFLLNLKVSSG